LNPVDVLIDHMHDVLVRTLLYPFVDVQI